MKKAAIQFGRLPYDIIAGGGIRGLKQADALVYLAISAHLNADWAAKVSLDRLDNLTGLTRQSVVNGIRRLKDKNLIKVKRGGGRSRCNTYQVTTNSQELLTVYNNKTVKPDHQNSQRSYEETVKPDHQNSQPPLTRTERTEYKQKQQEVDAVDGQSQQEKKQELLEALDRHGLGSASYLLGDFKGRLTPGLIDETMKGISSNAGTGARVNHFRAGIRNPKSDQPKRDPKATHLTKSQLANIKKRIKKITGTADGKKWIDDFIDPLPTEKLESYKKWVVNKWKPIYPNGATDDEIKCMIAFREKYGEEAIHEMATPILDEQASIP